ncbi:transporter substrate-binding domain-containing protein [uncultured Shewanella sp.]|uniref:transporter substrate-binding domain-containing protein n=1 Tax=uncultured Shewanella sp. TaxID=173975 RepID=UPI002630A212|nr:transporter substrate-binding domain-containing protein [uncultured Shewanella sp.]
MKFLIYFILILGMSSVVAFAFADDEKGKTDLILGMDGKSYPLQFINASGQPAGLLVDIWRVWAKNTQTNIQFKVVKNSDINESLVAKTIDLHIGHFDKNDNLNQPISALAALTSTNHYLYLHQALLVPDDIRQLSSFLIGVIQDSFTATILETEYPSLSLRYYSNIDSLIQATEKKQVYIIAASEGLLRSHQVGRQVSKGLLSFNRLLLKQSVSYPLVLTSQVSLINQLSGLYTQHTAQLSQKWLGKGQGSHYLTIGLPLNFAPYASIGIDGLAQGLLIDIWQAWSSHSGVKVDFVFNDDQTLYNSLKMGRIDGLLSYPNKDMDTNGFKEQQSLYQIKMRLFSYQTQITDIGTLVGKTVAFNADFAEIEPIKKWLPGVNFIHMDNISAMIQATEHGDVAAFIAPTALTQHYLLLTKKWQHFHQHPSWVFNIHMRLLSRDNGPQDGDHTLTQFDPLPTETLMNIERQWIPDPQKQWVEQQPSKLVFNEAETAYLTQLTGLKVGYLSNWKPMEFTDMTGQFSGINSDIFARIEAGLGVTLEPVAFEHWNDLLTALYQGDIDLAGSIANISERQHRLRFSQSYWPASWGVLTYSNAVNFFHLNDLAGLRVAVVEGYQLVPTLLTEQPELALVLVPDIDAGIKAMRQGHADVFIDKLVNLSMMLTHRRDSILKLAVLVDFAEQRSHIGIHPQHGLLPPLIDKVLMTIDTPTQQAIQQKWVTKLLPAKGLHSAQWRDLMVVTILVLVSLVVLIWLIRYGMKQKKGRSLN